MNQLDDGDKQLLQRGLARLDAANEVMRFLSDYFRDKYQLTPQHQITPNGEIVTQQLSMFGNLENSNDTRESPDGALSGAISSSQQ